MPRQKLISLCLLSSVLSYLAGCENIEGDFESDHLDRYNRFSDVCSKTDGQGDCVPYEAEDHTGTSSCEKRTNHTGYRGSGFMDFGGNGSWVEWNNVAAPVAGEYTLTFRYANGSSGNRQAAILVNGQQKGTVPFAKTDRWKNWQVAALKVSLRKGQNTIRVTANTGSGGPNLDNMLVVGKDLGGDDDDDGGGDNDNGGGFSKCAEADEHKNASLVCPSGEKIANIDFASYGLPTGSCDAGFLKGSCHASSSMPRVQSACLNKPSCNISANNGTFGDPCPGKFKRITIAYTCGGGGVDDQCPDDPGKTEPGECGCGVPEGTCTSDDYWESNMISYDSQGKLHHKTDGEGHRIPDFSYVGYKYGAAPPHVKVVHTISPVAGDNTNHIQKAIDHVASKFSKDSRGIRGALLLRPGTYRTDNPITVPHDGVVIRGSGKGNNPAVDTIIQSSRTGTDKEVFRLGHRGDPDWAWTAKFHSSITEVRDSVIQVGERSFNVQNSSPYKKGDVVVLTQKFNDQWFTDVDDGGTVSDPGWSERGIEVAAVYVRQVESKSGSRVTLDAPIYYKLDSKYGKITLQRHNDELSNSKNYRQIGIENLRIDIETEPGNIFDNNHTQHGIHFISVIDGWARDVTVLHFSESAIEVKRSMRITIDRCEGGPAIAKIEGGRRSGFSVRAGGQQVLIRDSSAIACRHGFVLSGATKSSGVVVLRGELIENIASSEGGHQQWSSGVLFDNCKVTSRFPQSRSPHITFLLGNRGDFGTSHGWSSVNSVMWNTYSGAEGSIVVQKPPTAQNYAIGCTGNINDMLWFPGEFGHVESGPEDGRALRPASLYEAQRADRL